MLAKLFIIELSLISLTAAYGTGAPNVACSNLTPNHGGITTQNVETSPYQIFVEGDLLNQYIYANNSAEVKITLKNIRTDTEPGFKGFLCTAEIQGQIRAGHFTSADTQVQTACSDDTGITHNSKVPKNEVELTWHSPPEGFVSQRVQIWCTFVKEYALFYKWMKGDNDIKVGIIKPTPSTYPPVIATAPTQAEGGQDTTTTTTTTTESTTTTTATTTLESTMKSNTATTPSSKPEETTKHDSHDAHQHKSSKSDSEPVKTAASLDSSGFASIANCMLISAVVSLLQL